MKMKEYEYDIYANRRNTTKDEAMKNSEQKYWRSDAN